MDSTHRWLVLGLVAIAGARDITDDEYARFPRLYHLDDYAGCLSQSDGLYCVGTFHITPVKEPDHTYNLIKEYSSDPHNFNRTQLHRGYCVSSRCPSLNERNASLRFERCAAQFARRRQLNTQLTEFGYCRTHAQEYARTSSPEPLDIPQRVFLLVVALLLVLNLIGTAYDVATGDVPKKNPKLLAWSIPENWRRLTAPYDVGDARLSMLTPVQGMRVILMALTVAVHAGCIHDMLYLYNPQWIEQMLRHPVLMLFMNGTSVVQVFVVLSNFLLAYNMLLVSKTHKLSFKMLPYIILKRVIRTFPLHMLMVAFAGTWWARSGSGPLWPLMVDAESEACRRKFWTHALYINNLVNPDDYCLVQTWFVAVDMQIYIVASALSLYLVNRRQRALSILGGLIIASCLLNGVLAYIFHWKSVMYFVYPETLNKMYKGIGSFKWLYISPWGSLPVCLIGVFAAHLHANLRDAGVKLSNYRWVRVPCHLVPVLMTVWILAGNWLQQYTHPAFMAAYVALERPVLGALAGLMMLGIVNDFQGWLWRLMAWRGWHAMGRMSLAVLVVHWCINMGMAAARPQPIASSVTTVMVDFVATTFFSYLVAVPLTILVEIPIQKFISSFL